ncbi:hypothetical protein CHARACLAT_010961 [Characodon lateralis]|uniref:Uncharacterized protein n=1 Tax=Characodon lateralis TaxID=208331 RepID=A0ABU7CWK3_9TELE|nr:hypothetical protein [Characodon lateralis]
MNMEMETKRKRKQENHRDYHNPPRGEQRRVPGEPLISHSAETTGSFSDEPTGLARSPLCCRRSSHGPITPKQRPDRARVPRPRQAATESEPAHTKAPSRRQGGKSFPPGGKDKGAKCSRSPLPKNATDPKQRGVSRKRAATTKSAAPF